MSNVCSFEVELIKDLYIDCIKSGGLRVNVNSQFDGQQLLSILTHNFEDLIGNVYQNVSGDWLVWIEPKLHG